MFGGLGGSGNGSALGASDGGDRLFEGTTSTQSGGVATVVVHADGSVDALLATSQGSARYSGTMAGSEISLKAVPAGGELTIAPTRDAGVADRQATLTCGKLSQSGRTCANAGYSVCGNGNCCPPDMPYSCATTTSCYATIDEANQDCGGSCIACGTAPTTSSTKPTTTPTTRNGKTMTACCIEGCNANGSCRSGG